MTKPTRRGRTPESSKSDQVRSLLATDMKPSDIANRVGCSTNLVYVVKSSTGAKKTTAPRRRGPGRPTKRAVVGDGLDGILAAVKNSERERTELWAALEKIQGLIAGVLE